MATRGPAEVEAFDSTFPSKEPVPPTALDALDGHVPARMLDALRSAGFPTVEAVRRRSSAEVAALEGVGEAGSEALRGFLRERGIPWDAQRHRDDAAAAGVSPLSSSWTRMT